MNTIIKDILSRDWLINSERELMEETAKSEPNTCVNRFTERINRTRGIPVSVQTVKLELKLGGGLRSGKLDGYRIPKEKNLRKFLQKQGYPFEDSTKILQDQKVEIVQEKIEQLHEEIVEKINNEKEENNMNNERKNELSKWTKLFLHVLRDNRFNPNGLILKIKSCYNIPHEELKKLPKELEANLIILRRGSKTRYELGFSSFELEELFSDVLSENTNQFMERVGIRLRRHKGDKPKPTLPIIENEKILKFLDEDPEPYDYLRMGKVFGLTSGEAFLLERDLIKKGFLIQFGLNGEKVMPSFSWHKKPEKKRAEFISQIKPDPTEEKTFKNFEEAFPTPKKEVVPQNSFPKDVVFKDSNVRIINNSGKLLQVEVCSTEIVVTIN